MLHEGSWCARKGRERGKLGEESWVHPMLIACKQKVTGPAQSTLSKLWAPLAVPHEISIKKKKSHRTIAVMKKILAQTVILISMATANVSMVTPEQ